MLLFEFAEVFEVSSVVVLFVEVKFLFGFRFSLKAFGLFSDDSEEDSGTCLF